MQFSDLRWLAFLPLLTEVTTHHKAHITASEMKMRLWEVQLTCSSIRTFYSPWRFCTHSPVYHQTHIRLLLSPIWFVTPLFQSQRISLYECFLAITESNFDFHILSGKHFFRKRSFELRYENNLCII